VLKASEDLTDDAAAMIAEVSESVSQSGGQLKVKFHPKVAALEQLAKHVGLYENKLDLTNSDGSLRPTIIRIVAVD
jgi:phage terminase small subunit